MASSDQRHVNKYGSKWRTKVRNTMRMYCQGITFVSNLGTENKDLNYEVCVCTCIDRWTSNP